MNCIYDAQHGLKNSTAKWRHYRSFALVFSSSIVQLQMWTPKVISSFTDEICVIIIGNETQKGKRGWQPVKLSTDLFVQKDLKDITRMNSDLVENMTQQHERRTEHLGISYSAYSKGFGWYSVSICKYTTFQVRYSKYCTSWRYRDINLFSYFSFTSRMLIELISDYLHCEREPDLINFRMS